MCGAKILETRQANRWIQTDFERHRSPTSPEFRSNRAQRSIAIASLCNRLILACMREIIGASTEANATSRSIHPTTRSDPIQSKSNPTRCARLINSIRIIIMLLITIRQKLLERKQRNASRLLRFYCYINAFLRRNGSTWPLRIWPRMDAETKPFSR